MIALRLGALSALVTIVAACESEPSSPAKDISAALTSSVPAGGYTVPEGDPLALVGGVTIKHGGYGSALAVDPKDPTLFYSLTDRGPSVTIDCGGTDVLAFPVPSFTPETGKFRLSGGELTRVGIIQLKQANGTRLTGLPQPNAEANRTEVPGNLDCSLLDQDPNGIDSEGLAIAKDGSFWVSDEYGPDVIHFSATGTTIQRLTPKNGLPLALARRRSNRGMEGLTILSDGKTLAGIMQSPLDNPTAGGSSAGRASRLVRIVLMDTRSGTTRQYGYILDAASNLASEITAVTPTLFLVDERNGTLPGDGTAIKKIYSVDITNATDLSDPTNGAGGKLVGGQTLEQLTSGVADPAATLVMNGIRVGLKSAQPVVDLIQAIQGYPHDKVEGLAILDNFTIAVSNDDDFGVTDDDGVFVPKILPLTGAPDFNTIHVVRLNAPLKP